MNNFIVYNTHIYAFGPEKQDGYTACHHHHQGQNRPHQKNITGPAWDLHQLNLEFESKNQSKI